MKNKNDETPWIEKYRPRTLNEIISQDDSINILNNTLKTGELPHLLLHGSPGTGKTSSILALCNQLFGPNRVNERVIELNASDERGINVVRGKIINFAKIAVGTVDENYLCPPYKIIILDEADAMTKEAQAALRKVMEENSNITRFCFICNYINQIIEPINSRCIKIRFKPIDNDSIISKLNIISKKEGINIDENGLSCIAEISNGDLRKGILILQNVKYLGYYDLKDQNIITKKNIYKMCKYISQEELYTYILSIKKNNKLSNIIKITKDIINKGFIFNSLITRLIDYVINNEIINEKNKAKILF